MSARQEAPKMYRHRPSGQWVVKINRRMHYLGKDEQAARERYRDVIAAHWQGRSQPTRRLLCSELLERWLNDEGKRVRNFGRLQAAARAVNALHAGTPAAEFDQLALAAVRARLLARKGSTTGRALSRRYVNVLVNTIRQAFSWAAGRKLVPTQTLLDLRTLRPLRRGEGGRELPRVAPPPPGAVEATLPHLPPTVQAMVRVHRLTGMRPGELCMMRPCDLSRAPGEPVEVPGQGFTVEAIEAGGVVVWVYVPHAHKLLWRERARIILVGPRAQAELVPLLAGRRPDHFIFNPTGSPTSCYSTRSYCQAVQRGCRRAGVPVWSPNRLRHEAATRMREVAGLEAAGDMLGHATPEMTAHYARAALGRLAEHLAREG